MRIDTKATLPRFKTTSYLLQLWISTVLSIALDDTPKTLYILRLRPQCQKQIGLKMFTLRDK